jgi:chromosomal replication initiation ATPase DnaA
MLSMTIPVPDTSGAAAHPQQMEDGARALAAAVTQIEVALREARTPVENLGNFIGRVANTFATLRASHTNDEQQAIEQLKADLYDGIQQMQFYDRMVQHLSHVQDYLSAVADRLAGVAASDDNPQAWDSMRQRLRTRLISDAQRELLDLVLPPPSGTAATRQDALIDRANQGSVELF